MAHTRLSLTSISIPGNFRYPINAPVFCLSSAVVGDGRPWKPSCSRRCFRRDRTKFVSFALAEPGIPKSLGEDEAVLLLREMADCFRLPSDFFQQLPRDLRLDLNDAAFDLANGPVIEECGEELGQMLLNLSEAWEQADTLTSSSIVNTFSQLVKSLADSSKSAFGRRLTAAGRRFQAMGQYGGGELQRIAKIMLKTGKLLSARPAIQNPKAEARMFKVALTPGKANVGAAVGFVFGLLSLGLSRVIESVPEGSLEQSNDNALMLTKSIHGALLLMCYSSTLLSGFATVGLILLGRQLSSEKTSK